MFTGRCVTKVTSIAGRRQLHCTRFRYDFYGFLLSTDNVQGQHLIAVIAISLNLLFTAEYPKLTINCKKSRLNVSLDNVSRSLGREENYQYYFESLTMVLYGAP